MRSFLDIFWAWFQLFMIQNKRGLVSLCMQKTPFSINFCFTQWISKFLITKVKVYSYSAYCFQGGLSSVVPKLFWCADHLKYFSGPRSSKYWFTYGLADRLSFGADFGNHCLSLIMLRHRLKQRCPIIFLFQILHIFRTHPKLYLPC